MRQSTRATTWTCNGCPVEVVRTDLSQDTPPDGWRLLTLLPVNVNLALEPGSPSEVKKRVVCPECFASVAGIFL